VLFDVLACRHTCFTSHYVTSSVSSSSHEPFEADMLTTCSSKDQAKVPSVIPEEKCRNDDDSQVQVLTDEMNPWDKRIWYRKDIKPSSKRFKRRVLVGA
jgi:hypothetical protein